MKTAELRKLLLKIIQSKTEDEVSSHITDSINGFHEFLDFHRISKDDFAMLSTIAVMKEKYERGGLEELSRWNSWSSVRRHSEI